VCRWHSPSTSSPASATSPSTPSPPHRPAERYKVLTGG
jgi:hypothetical protein